MVKGGKTGSGVTFFFYTFFFVALCFILVPVHLVYWAYPGIKIYPMSDWYS